MTDRTHDQISQTLDRLLEVTAETVRLSEDNTRNIANLQQSIGELTTYTRNRTQQHDLELDDHDERVERLERDHLQHADRMEKLENLLIEIKEERKDIRAILQMMTARFAGEPPMGEN